MPATAAKAQPEYSKLALKTLTAIAKFLGPKVTVAKDSKPLMLDRRFMLGVTKKNFHTSRPMIVKAVSKQIKPHLAKDANLDGIHKLLDSLDPDAGKDEERGGPIPIKSVADVSAQPSDIPGQGDEDPVHGHIREYLAGKMSDDDVNGLLEHLKGKKAEGEDEQAEEDMEDVGAEDDPPNFEGMPKVGKGPAGKDKHMGKDKRIGRDELHATVKAATEGVEKKLRAEFRATNEAIAFVQPWTGKLTAAFDSADEVYRHALKTVGVKDAEKIHSSALKTVLEAYPKPGEAPRGRSTTIAADVASAAKSFNEMYPGASRVRVMN